MERLAKRNGEDAFPSIVQMTLESMTLPPEDMKNIRQSKRPLAIVFTCMRGGTSGLVKLTFDQVVKKNGLEGLVVTNALGITDDDRLEERGRLLKDADYIVPMYTINKNDPYMGYDEEERQKILNMCLWNGFDVREDIRMSKILIRLINSDLAKRKTT